MDNVISNGTYTVSSAPAPNYSHSTMSTSIDDPNALWDFHNENMLSLLPGEFDQEWDTILPLENLSSISTPGVAANPIGRGWDPCNEMMSSLLPSLFVQDSHTLPPLESPSSTSSGVATSSNQNVALQNYQDISILDTGVNIWEVADSTNVDNSVHQFEEMHSNQDVALLKEKTNLHQGYLTGNSRFTTDDPSGQKFGDSGRAAHRHSARAVSIMRKWFDENLSHPYPHTRELIKLSEKTHLSIDQVNTWFSNERQRKSRGRGIERVGMTLKMKNKLPEDSVRVLKAWAYNHSGNPRPTTIEKKFLAQKAELKLQQVSDWFGNYRKKQLQSQLKDQEGLIKMGEGGLGMSDLDAQEPVNTAEIQDQNIGLVFQPEQAENTALELDFWDEERLLSYLHALPLESSNP